MSKISFDTKEYVVSHGKQPKGWGVWGFFVEQDGKRTSEPIFSSKSCSYTDAKKEIKHFIQVMAPGQDATVVVAP